MLQVSTVKFLKDLSRNNNKPWFDAHRQQYEDAKNDFAQFIQTVIDKHAKKDPAIGHLKAKDCTFRINRDVRFSKDKSPYKNNMGAYINQGGKKSLLGGYYFHCQPGQSFVGGGLWMPMPPELKKVRQEIDYNLDAFKKIIGSKKFKEVYGGLSKDAEYVLTRVPKGYDPDNPAAEFLKMKSFVAMTPIKDAELGSKELLKKVSTAFETLQPMLAFINQSIEG
ncbi:DUF2461 domain-containing protein [Terrimonas pollutisoli]|uniref:DUF2461 domain-containing protein n=1 Tax=Terrimonas pollutisoli TaxID=3034147 RepID=UPI0023EC50B0|nr:DUF2461 domain-containing protein [Terrimonas sp. H1YJ31]